MDREHIWDWAKGVSILAVIAIHSFGMAHLAPWEVWFTVIGRQFVNFAVPLFLAVSGYFQGRSASRSASAYAQLRRLWPPYILWTVVFVLLFRRHDLTSPVALLTDIFGGRGIGGIGYFVIVLTQMILLLPILDRIASVRGQVAVMALLTPVGLGLTYGLSGQWACPGAGRFQSGFATHGAGVRARVSAMSAP
jgi:surface polysaccharide O-acyltransferase-like enzyme